MLGPKSQPGDAAGRGRTSHSAGSSMLHAVGKPSTAAQADDSRVQRVVEATLNARLLIVDDEEHNVRLLLRILRWAGYTQIRSTTDPMMVPGLVAEFAPDLILLDLHMPGRDGFGVLEQLAADPHAPSPRLPVLMLTGDDSAVVKRRALALGASDFVAKPLDEQEVALRIRNLIETRMLHRALGEQNALL